MTDTLLVSRSGDVLAVGRKRPNESVEIVNVFQGDEAEELYRRLLEKKENKENADARQD